MAKKEESRQYDERLKKKGNNKSDWDSPKKEEEKAKEEVKKEEVKEKKIEIISYKEYLEKKEIVLKKLAENKNIDKELDRLLRKMNFFNVFKRKIQVNLTQTEYKQETENLKKYFQVSLEIIKQEVQNIFVITEEKEVAVAEVVEKNNTTDEKAILNKVSKSLFENATEIKNNDKLSEKERKEKLLKMLKENIELLEKETDQFDEEDIASILKK